MKELSELPDFKDMKLESHGMPKNWGFSCGGKHMDYGQWAIQHVHDDLSVDVYLLPLWITPLVRWREKNARREMQDEIRNALGINPYSGRPDR
ncbi:amino acid permease-associated region [Roseibium sp. TrichSKD4]|uniref:hypothetical protein n=1 Tax=Roseibium sp. TrichSKD4 TaxID=744980 RepID=UPI0001E563FD|nr:hypothetical protein [Roseibium sp. TrichSKD4]EFO32579.1 amino acid permease-associated region [Roseibium sp. TrichSKD4]EFO33947.1 amino acid permease-associated region [Roseibium sp. TrichSKD4]